jgi:hypothetical protein
VSIKKVEINQLYHLKHRIFVGICKFHFPDVDEFASLSLADSLALETNVVSRIIE